MPGEVRPGPLRFDAAAGLDALRVTHKLSGHGAGLGSELRDQAGLPPSLSLL